MGVENSILVRLRIWRTGRHTSTKNFWEYLHLNSCVVLFSDLLILFFLYLEPISTVFTPVVLSPHFILIRMTRMTRMIRIARVTEITKMTLMNRVTL